MNMTALLAKTADLTKKQIKKPLEMMLLFRFLPHLKNTKVRILSVKLLYLITGQYMRKL